MKSKKKSQKVKMALTLGILAGFVALAIIFKLLDHKSLAESDMLFWVAIGTSMISVFLPLLESPKKENCSMAAGEETKIS